MLGAGKNTVEIIIAAKDRFTAPLVKAKAQMAGLQGRVGKLGGAVTKLSPALSSAVSTVRSFGAALGPVGIAVAGIGVVMATLGGAAIKASLEFEKAFATIRVGTGATGESLAGLEGSFKTVFTSVPASTADAATAIADLNTRLGLTGEPLESLATQFLNLSRITGTDVAAGISSATRVMHDFDVVTSEQGASLDYLFKVSQSTGIGMTQLGNSMTQYGSVMRQMGFDINESAALLGKFEKEGVNLQLVLGSLRQGLAKFSKAGEEPVEALARVSAEIKSMGSVADANALAIETFGARAGPDMAAAIREGRFSIEELMATLDASGETINKAAADTLTFGDKWTLLKNNIMEAIAPIGDVITNVLGNAIEGLSGIFDGLQTVIGPAFNLITIRFQVLKAFLEGFFTPIAAALAPLKETLEALQQKFAETSGKLSILSDVFTIITGAAKWLGEAIGSLVAMALTPLVAKLQEGIAMLGAFYDKLGPIKGALEWIGEGVHNVAESFRETKPPIEEVGTALEELSEKGSEGPKAIADAWALAIKDFQEGTGTYKEAIGGIEEKIAALTEEWMTATDKRKAAIENEVKILNDEKSALTDLKETADDTLGGIAEKTEEATEKQKEFEVTIGDTTIKFKDAAAEVLKNADAYEKLQDSAQKIIDLDWAVFAEFEASLPKIEAGIQDMASAFTGLEGILEDNIEELESVKESVMGISEIAAPFLESGFLNGIKSIGSFAGTLKDAGSAINDFSSLQDVSIKGCINFSLHVRDMVSALEILESQMEDLVPSFKKMNSLIGDIQIGFLSGIDITALYGEEWKHMQSWFANTTADVARANGIMARSFGLTVDEIKILREEGTLTTYAFLKQTSALKTQTGQLNKITEALEPYLNFMRTLNELAALSALSTDDLNNGLNAINDTLGHLGKSLETFDLRPVMETLFGTKIAAGEFTGGIATGFMDTMTDFQGPFSNLITYVERLTSSIFSLVSSFEALVNISDSVLADQTKLKEVFEGIIDVMSNFSTEMGGTEGFAQKFADGMDAMLKSASPLIKYFEDNNAAIELFNKSLSSFSDTITNVIGVFEDLASVVERSSELIVVSAEEIETALSLVDDQLIEIVKYIESPAWDEIVTQLGAVSKEWEKWALAVDNSMPAFSSAVDTFSTLISTILGLSSALEEMRDMTVFTVRDMDKALKNIPIFLDRFVDALALNMYEIKMTLKDLDREWALHTDEMKATIPTYEDATDKISKLISPILSLNSALKQLAEMGTISATTFDKGFISLMDSVSNFAVSLGRNVDGLILSLSSLRKVWIENEDVLYPLIYDFAIISDNLWGVAYNANRMAKEFKNISDNAGTLEKGFKDLIVFIETVVALTKEFYTTEAAAELARYIDDVGKVIAAFVDLEIELKSAMDKIKTAIGSAVDNIKGKISSLDNLVKSAFLWGANTLIGFIGGIYSMEKDLALAAARMAGTVAAYLDGSVRSAYYWGSNLMIGFINGIYSMEAALALAAARMAATVKAYLGASSNTETASGRGGSATIYITQNISDRETADYANKGLERVLQRHAIM
jgi:TP901 family phage tail tape measure protein